ncbi:MAG: hypothetical protein NZL85_07540, partial [Fimbriimonadales bacterium]|nr:hypothetical protein [Fimbriimonadales bacterium]
VAQTVRLLDRPREAEVEAPATAQAAVGSPSVAPTPPRTPLTPEPEEEFEMPDEFIEESYEVEGDPFEQM